MSDLAVSIHVKEIRARGMPGGAIFSGVTESGETYVANCTRQLLPDASLLTKGQVWAIRGPAKMRSAMVDGRFLRHEKVIEATSAELLRPSGQQIVSWIANSPDCIGIGPVKARKLYDQFGPALADKIEAQDWPALTAIVNEESARHLCNAFAKFKVANALLWLDRIEMPRRLGQAVIDYWGDKTQERIEANPYALVSFEADWTKVDHLARARFAIAKDDPRRLLGAVEEVLYGAMKQGHTSLPGVELRRGLQRLLRDPALISLALSCADSRSEVRHWQHDDIYQAAGPYLIEAYVASRLRAILDGESDVGQVGLFSEIIYDAEAVARAIRQYESTHFNLGDKQKEAVQTCVAQRLSLILGGAGTGKTTVLKALYHVLDELQPGVPIYQLALAGRAAQRMAQATGREAMTIAGFLTKIDPATIAIGSVVVVDEMSMVDVILMYKLLRHIPDGVRLILVGDPAQLPPIGPGLVLHALVGLTGIPQTELDVVMRQSAVSGIPQIAAAIRAHQQPVYTPYSHKPDAGVSFVHCAPSQLEAKVQEIYHELGGRGADFAVQVLSITKSNVGGITNLNSALHNRYQSNVQQVNFVDPEFGVVGARTLAHEPLCVGDLVIFTENDYFLDLRNGSLGQIVEALPVTGASDPCCRCEFEGKEYVLDSTQIGPLSHAYAVTVHKAQGSQFNRVIVPIRTSRLLDQALIYTAVTRGIEQVVIVGDEEATSKAIMAPASAAERHIALPMLLAEAERESKFMQ
ncbi:MAG: AAA family ATPase [Burkholderiales bacterium]